MKWRMIFLNLLLPHNIFNINLTKFSQSNVNEEHSQKRMSSKGKCFFLSNLR